MNAIRKGVRPGDPQLERPAQHPGVELEHELFALDGCEDGRIECGPVLEEAGLLADRLAGNPADSAGFERSGRGSGHGAMAGRQGRT